MHDAWKLALVLGACCLVAVDAAQAQIATNVDELIRHGVELRRRGDDQGALVEFRGAYEAGHSPRAAAQMGWAEQALGRWLDADGHIREAMAATTDTWIVGHRALLDASVMVINQRVGNLEVLGGVAGAEVRVDGRLAGTMPLASPARASAGAVTLRVTAAGYRPVERQVMVAAGGLARETIELQPVTAAETHAVPRTPVPCREGQVAVGDASDHCCWHGQRWTAGSTSCSGAPRCPDGFVAHGAICERAPVVTGNAIPILFASSVPTPEQPRHAPVRAAGGSPLRTLGAVGIGAGLLFVGGGAVAHVLFVLGVADFNRPTSGCQIDDVTRAVRGGAMCQNIVSSGRTEQALAIAGYVVGGVVAVTGLVLVIVAPASPTRLRAGRISCGPGPGLIGLGCGGAF